jgi:hypothetical protein
MEEDDDEEEVNVGSTGTIRRIHSWSHCKVVLQPGLSMSTTIIGLGNSSMRNRSVTDLNAMASCTAK